MVRRFAATLRFRAEVRTLPEGEQQANRIRPFQGRELYGDLIVGFLSQNACQSPYAIIFVPFRDETPVAFQAKTAFRQANTIAKLANSLITHG